ncbi:MAG: histone deacetylase family protein [Acetobacteraceae bacterium]
MKAFWDPVQLAHAPRFFLQRGRIRDNYERPARAEALLDGCRALGLEITAPPPAPRAALERVHPAAYLDYLRDGPAAWAALDDSGPEIVANIHPAPEMLATGGRPSASIIAQAGWFSADAACPVSAETWAAAESAAACALAAADEVLAGRDSYALARPPGHHAYPARAGGHCYLNNAAMAAEHLRAQGARRVAILDIDSHHGNGTQGIFWHPRRRAVRLAAWRPGRLLPMVCRPCDELGAGPGVGFNRNFPLARGTDDLAWLAALDTGLRTIERFGADALVVSLGFDASRDEPLHYLSVSADGFARAGAAIGKLALPAAFIQEGGYNTDTLGPLLQTFLSAFSG